MYRVWYSTESFADYVIDNTKLSSLEVVKHKMYESDANNPYNFHSMPDHIRKILYLDAPDLIVELDSEPIFSIEVTTEAGTGHNAFQRFARIAASVENQVPAFYIYPEGAIITRKGTPTRWDKLNPLIFPALESVMDIYKIPALLYYFPTDIRDYPNQVSLAPHKAQKGLRYDSNIIKYTGCPDSSDSEMKLMFKAIDEIINVTISMGVIEGRASLLSNLVIRERKSYMQDEYHAKRGNKSAGEMSPATSTIKVPSEYVVNYLSNYTDSEYEIGELLRNRKETIIYQVNAGFRGDPYPGCLSALDYLFCREGKSFEERRYNLILLWGKVSIDEENKTLEVIDERGSTIKDFFRAVQSCASKNLLTRDYEALSCKEIPRYYMQVRYGSTYSKVKHIRVFSYFADAIIFPDGSLWRDA